MPSFQIYQGNKKDFFFANFSNYSKDRHFAANGYQNVTFGDIKTWKKLKNGSFFHKIKHINKKISGVGGVKRY